MTPFVQDPDLTIHVGDVREVLATLPDGSVDCVVTSPPYWGLRDYGTGQWEGGNPDCDHAPQRGLQGKSEASQRADRSFTGSKPQGETCGRCGARRVDQQLGLEPTPDCGQRGFYRLRSDLTAEQREYVARRLAGVESPDA